MVSAPDLLRISHIVDMSSISRRRPTVCLRISVSIVAWVACVIGERGGRDMRAQWLVGAVL